MAEHGGIPRFVDPGAEAEHGFASRWGRPELPGLGWEAGNMFTTTTFMANINMEDAEYDDRVWWVGADSKLRLRQEHPALQEIFYNIALLRHQAVEQLTTPPPFTTIPNTAAFPRAEHLWGSVLSAHQIGTQAGMGLEELVIPKLRTLVSDVGHTFGSHLGDWMFQGMGGAENQHDIELRNYLEVVGINDILRKHNIDPDTVIFPDVNDWIEASQPDLCIDRVDYGLREMNRWNQVIHSQAFGSGDFTLTPEGMLAMKDQQRARLFSEGFLLLSQEHWAEPTHRAILDLYMLRTKLFYAQGGTPRTWVFNPDLSGEALVPLHDIHPRDLMYITDPSNDLATAYPNLIIQTLDALMKSIAQYRRQYVWPGRNDRINAYMHQFVGNGYDTVCRNQSFERMESERFNTYLGEYPQSLPLGFAILSEAEAAAHPPGEGVIDFYQNPLKTRQIDPLVRTDTGFERLSVLDPSYAVRLAEHKAQMIQPHIARIVIPDLSTYTLLKQAVDNAESEWQRRLQTSRRMTPEELRALVGATSSEIHGSYPFMNFLDY